MGGQLCGRTAAGDRVRGWRARFAAIAAGAVLVAGCSPSAADGQAGATPAPTPSPSPTPSPQPPPPPEPPPEPPETPDPDASECSIAGGGGGGAAELVSTWPRHDDAGSAGWIGSSRSARAGERATGVGQRLRANRNSPWDDRPVVRLCFDVPADRQEIQGLEQVLFTPDRPTCEVIFRAWPNKPETARAGNSLVVDTAVLDGEEVAAEVEPAGAPEDAPGTLIRLPVEDCLEVGDEVEIVLEFTLTLGANTPERVGYDPDELVAWFGTAFPLLAWERGRGWATEPAVDLFGEMTTSETFELELLEVVAPDEDVVLGTGRSQGTRPGRAEGTTVHRFAAEAVRDVAITAGDLEVVEREVSGVRLHVAAVGGINYPLEEWADEHGQMMVRLMTYFGEFPYQDLWVSVLPAIPSGIEFPGAIQYGDVDLEEHSQLVPHELAHMWFYGLVGNNQARDPWLDEAFAEYAEILATGRMSEVMLYDAPGPVRGEVGESMSWYADLNEPGLYAAGVYRQGGAMLHRARQVVGPQDWDTLLRQYVDENAHRTVTPADVSDMVADHPDALAVLREYGALRD